MTKMSMFENIVVLVDMSETGQIVLPHALAITEIFNSQATILHVLEPSSEGKTVRIDPVDWHLRKIEAQSYLDHLSKQGKRHGHLEIELLEGRAPNRISEYIEMTNPNLTILGSHGSGGLSPWNISSVAQKIVYRTHRSFMLVRAFQQQAVDKSMRYRRIAVPLDGSKHAEWVLPVASRIAAAHDAQLILIHAQSLPFVFHSHSGPLSPEIQKMWETLTAYNKQETDQYLSKLVDRLNLNVMTMQLTGPNPADALLQYVQENDIDLVVMSAHGDSGETIRPFGSIVSSFIAYGSTSLLIIQDLPLDQIKATQAELEMAGSANTKLENRNIAYAQPADWKSF